MLFLFFVFVAASTLVRAKPFHLLMQTARLLESPAAAFIAAQPQGRFKHIFTKKAEVVTVRSVVELSVTVDYSLYERASLLIDAAGAKQAAPQFTDRVTLCWQMPEHTEGPLLEQLRELTRGGAQVHVSEPFYAPF